MRASNFFISLWVAAILYGALTLFAGAQGLSTYNHLMREQEKQRINLETLKNINQKLEGDKNALLYDSDAIAVYARELGYGSEDEQFVRIVGLSGTAKQSYHAGRTLVAAKPPCLSNRMILVISSIVGMIMLILLYLLRTAGEED